MQIMENSGTTKRRMVLVLIEILMLIQSFARGAIATYALSDRCQIGQVPMCKQVINPCAKCAEKWLSTMNICTFYVKNMTLAVPPCKSWRAPNLCWRSCPCLSSPQAPRTENDAAQENPLWPQGSTSHWGQQPEARSHSLHQMRKSSPPILPHSPAAHLSETDPLNFPIIPISHPYWMNHGLYFLGARLHSQANFGRPDHFLGARPDF